MPDRATLVDRLSGRPSPAAAAAAQLPELARALARAFAAGLPLDAAADRSADVLPEPSASLLRAGAVATRRGAPPATALGSLAALRGGGLIVGAIVLNGELGGDLVAALHALADGLADRELLEGELAAATAQARFAGRIVPVVPFGALGLLALMSPDSVRPLVTTAVGLGACATSATLTLAATVVMRRIVRAALA